MSDNLESKRYANQEREQNFEFQQDIDRAGIARGDTRKLERRSSEARNHQLPHLQTGAGRAFLRKDIRSGQGLRMPLRKIQTHPLQGYRLRPVRCGGDREEGAQRAYGAHIARRPGSAHLVFPFASIEDRLPARHPHQDARCGHLLRAVHRGTARRGRRVRRFGEGPAGGEGVPRHPRPASERQRPARRRRPEQVHRPHGCGSHRPDAPQTRPRYALLFATRPARRPRSSARPKPSRGSTSSRRSASRAKSTNPNGWC